MAVWLVSGPRAKYAAGTLLKEERRVPGEHRPV
jgi:hypothetical protein